MDDMNNAHQRIHDAEDELATAGFDRNQSRGLTKAVATMQSGLASKEDINEIKELITQTARDLHSSLEIQIRDNRIEMEKSARTAQFQAMALFLGINAVVVSVVVAGFTYLP